MTGGEEWSRRSVVAVGLAVAVLVGLASIAAVEAAGLRADRAEDRRAEEAITFASQTVEDLTTMDPDTATATLGQIAEESTGDFRTKVVALTEPIAKAVAAAGVSAEGTVTSAGVSSVDDRAASVLVAARVSLDGATEDSGYRLRVDLRRDGGSWVLADVATVP